MNELHAGLRAGRKLVGPHITHSSSISPPLLHIENITLYFTRGLREQNIYYLTRNSVQAKYVQQNVAPPTEHVEPTSEQSDTEHFDRHEEPQPDPARIISQTSCSVCFIFLSSLRL